MDLRRPITEHRARTVAAPASVVWDVVAAIGGPGGWGTFDPAWRLRGRVDEALGGPGMRGRPRAGREGGASTAELRAAGRAQGPGQFTEHLAARKRTGRGPDPARYGLDSNTDMYLDSILNLK